MRAHDYNQHHFLGSCGVTPWGHGYFSSSSSPRSLTKYWATYWWSSSHVDMLLVSIQWTTDMFNFSKNLWTGISSIHHITQTNLHLFTVRTQWLSAGRTHRVGKQDLTTWCSWDGTPNPSVFGNKTINLGGSMLSFRGVSYLIVGMVFFITLYH